MRASRRWRKLWRKRALRYFTLVRYHQLVGKGRPKPLLLAKDDSDGGVEGRCIGTRVKDVFVTE